jgi:hypothetical protein
MIREASYYGKMAVGWWKFIRGAPVLDAEAAIRRGLAEREQNFLDVLKRGVFESSVSPYRKLFAWAGCGYEDVKRAVDRDGLEAALEQLRSAGIYLTHDEFKGKKAIVRGGNSMTVEPEQFTNPLAEKVMEGSSSGSRSRGTISPRSLEYLHHREAQESLYWREFGVYDRPIVMLMQILPSSVGLRRAVAYVRRGGRLDAWFTLGGRVHDAHYHAVTKLLVAESRLLGLRIPYPEALPHNDFSPVAKWIAERKAAGENVAMMSNVSSGVRVAAAARELGLDISGSQFFVGAEQLTDAKCEAIERTGAGAHARYGCSEIGMIGMACPEMRGNCVHLMEDSLAVLNHRKLAPLSGVEVDSLLFTTLRWWAPLLFVNAEMDDAGQIGPATCDCGLKRLGLTKQVDRIFSYGKLTGQGTTLVGSDLLDILERVLPDRFGGAPTDYQLVEKEGSNQTEIELRVHPRLGLNSEDDVRRFFLQKLKKVWGGSMTERHWTRTEGVRVVFAEPFLVGKRKVLPLHLLGTTNESSIRPN